MAISCGIGVDAFDGGNVGGQVFLFDDVATGVITGCEDDPFVCTYVDVAIGVNGA